MKEWKLKGATQNEKRIIRPPICSFSLGVAVDFFLLRTSFMSQRYPLVSLNELDNKKEPT